MINPLPHERLRDDDRLLLLLRGATTVPRAPQDNDVVRVDRDPPFGRVTTASAATASQFRVSADSTHLLLAARSPNNQMLT